jgi:hypothetical protein
LDIRTVSSGYHIGIKTVSHEYLAERGRGRETETVKDSKERHPERTLHRSDASRVEQIEETFNC